MNTHDEIIRLMNEATLHNVRETRRLQLREANRPDWFWPCFGVFAVALAVLPWLALIVVLVKY